MRARSLPIFERYQLHFVLYNSVIAGHKQALFLQVMGVVALLMLRLPITIAWLMYVVSCTAVWVVS